MRKQWVGDSRDYVKWSCVYRVAGQQSIVLYVPMLRPDIFAGENLEPAVQVFFDELKSFNIFSRLFPGRFHSIEAEYTKSDSDEYFEDVLRRLIELQKQNPVVVFVDPDTGLEPISGSKDEHLQIRHFRKLASALCSGDRIILYQHASRDAGWRERQHQRLLGISDPNAYQVSEPYYEPETAKDVCFFTVARL